MDNYKNYRPELFDLPIKGDLDQQKEVVMERFKRLKSGDRNFLGYIDPSQKQLTFIQFIKRLWKQA